MSKVKFTPQEMASEPLADYSHLKFKRRKAPNRVELDQDLAVFFGTADAVNNALRKVMEAIPVETKRRRKAS